MRSKQLTSSFLSRSASIAALLITAAVMSATGPRAETAPLTASAFPGKNGALAVVKDRYRTEGSGNGTGIFVVAPDGSGAHWFTSGRARDPSWSPDGKHLLFTRRQWRELWIADQHGRNETKISQAPGDFESPDWSSDGSQILFEDYNGTHVARLIRAGLKQAHLIAADLHQPAWSPVAPEIALVRSLGQLLLVDADGSNKRVLTSSFDISWPSWSPDGKTIAFTRCVYHQGTWLSLIDRDGSNLRNLVQLPKGSCRSRPTAWSPDGTQIAFVSGPALERASLEVVAADGTNERTILRNVDGCCRISWQPLRR